MKLGLRIFFCYLIIFILCFSYPLFWVMDTMRTRYLEGIEDPLVDQANILAEIVSTQMARHNFNPLDLNALFERVYHRPLKGRIYSLTKESVDLEVYITDAEGKVVFHSVDQNEIGKDYTHWRDVGLTLEGHYGARTTLADPDDPMSTVLYVAAPIILNNRIEGVLAVAKPTTNINRFLKAAKPRIMTVVGVAGLVAIIMSYLTALWITRPIKRLTSYADAIRAGKRSDFPRLDRTEIGDLGRSLQRMQERLEGKAYVEEYVQKLTHEVKSPLSAIRGAAELLEEDMPEDRKKRFLTNIRTEAGRIQTIVDRMLELVALEFKKQLNKREPVNISAGIKTVLESKRPMLISKKIVVSSEIDTSIDIAGDAFLLHQAFSNLIQNAIDFSEVGGSIRIRAEVEADQTCIMVEDNGSVIPQYAIEKIFDKFYSLQRPDSGKKSTGLGLNLVQEVAQLHGGYVHLTNLAPTGVCAKFSVPHNNR